MAAEITGLGVLSPLGHSAQSLLQSLLAGGRRPDGSTAFSASSRLTEAAQAVTAPPETLLAAEVQDFDVTEYLGRGNLRPLDRTARLAAAAAATALGRIPGDHSPNPSTAASDAEAGVEAASPEAESETEVGLILGTMYGSVHTIASFDHRAQVAGPKYAKPMDFANSVINAAAGQTAIWHGLTGINSTLSAGTASGAVALAYGLQALRDGRSRKLLAGGAEELCWESYLAFHRAGLLRGQEESPGFILGEGAALLCLEPEGVEGSRSLGRLLGAAMTFDPSRGEDPTLASAALSGAVEEALRQARREPAQVAAAVLSCCGWEARDRAEARGLAAVLGEQTPRVAVTALSAALGHSLGASGALQAAILLAALAEGQLPGLPPAARKTAQILEDEGFQPQQSPYDLDLSSHPVALVTAQALDGPTAALVFERPRSAKP
ncbi:MAG: beta-ketoacyl synthase N-terminal-like domain-containing protein [Acidobacteriota bacterium]